MHYSNWVRTTTKYKFDFEFIHKDTYIIIYYMCYFSLFLKILFRFYTNLLTLSNLITYRQLHIVKMHNRLTFHIRYIYDSICFKIDIIYQILHIYYLFFWSYSFYLLLRKPTYVDCWYFPAFLFQKP